MADPSIRDFRRGLRALERQIERILIAQTECCGVTPAQCHLLLEVEGAGEASVGELAASLDLDASTLSRTVDALVRAGMLERQEDPANRRRQLVRLSAAGREKAEYINARCDLYYKGLLGALPECDAGSLCAAIPLFVTAMRSWRLEEGKGSCCKAAEETVR